MKKVPQKRFVALTTASIGLAIGLSVPAVWAADAEDAIKVETQTIKDGQVSQKKIDKLSDQTQKMLDEYKLVLRQTEGLRAYNDQMERLVASQDDEKASLAKQIGEIELTSREVVPMMSDMLSTLEEFVKLDMPFLPSERTDRIANLKNELNRADVSTSEKFRRIMEAYQVESEYGRTIEAYRGDIKGDGDSKTTVDFLRIGRIALLYQTLDGKISKAWDQKAQKWQDLDARYAKSIQNGLKIARKQSAPDLLTLPIPTPEAKL